MPSLAGNATPLGARPRGLTARVHKNAAVVALANKLVRIVWAVLRGGATFNADGPWRLREVKRDGLTVDRRLGTLGFAMAPRP